MVKDEREQLSFPFKFQDVCGCNNENVGMKFKTTQEMLRYLPIRFMMSRCPVESRFYIQKLCRIWNCGHHKSQQIQYHPSCKQLHVSCPTARVGRTLLILLAMDGPFFYLCLLHCVYTGCQVIAGQFFTFECLRYSTASLIWISSRHYILCICILPP